MKISMKLVYQYMTIFFNFQNTSNHLHPLQVENCDSNSRLVVDEDDTGKFRLERVKHPQSTDIFYINYEDQRVFFQLEIIIKVLVSYFRFFEYLCYDH